MFSNLRTKSESMQNQIDEGRENIAKMDQRIGELEKEISNIEGQTHIELDRQENLKKELNREKLRRDKALAELRQEKRKNEKLVAVDRALALKEKKKMNEIKKEQKKYEEGKELNEELKQIQNEKEREQKEEFEKMKIEEKNLDLKQKKLLIENEEAIEYQKKLEYQKQLHEFNDRCNKITDIFEQRRLMRKFAADLEREKEKDLLKEIEKLSNEIIEDKKNFSFVVGYISQIVNFGKHGDEVRQTNGERSCSL